MHPDIKNRRANHVTFAEFGDFLTDKGVGHKCSECDHDVLAINTIGGDDVGLVGLPIVNVASDGVLETPGTVSLAALSMSCENCGYTKFFTLSSVMRWLEEKKKVEGKHE